MTEEKHFLIGDVSRICNISRKALRYYDEINLIPSLRDHDNNYRYYTEEALLAVPVIKYYKTMGFTLEEMKEFIEGENANIFKSLQASFLAKSKELKQQQQEIRRKHICVKEWYDLITEAETVISNDIREVSIKFVESSDLLFMDQDFDGNQKAALINIDFTKHIEKLENSIAGPVIINFSSRQDRMIRKEQRVKIMQKSVMPCPEEYSYQFGGSLMASCYHIGRHDDIGETYLKIAQWAKVNGYILDNQSFERYVTDYWTTNNISKFVTEIMIKVTRPNH
ncbi:MerR family transcriptional regulator [Desulfosediminicola sp.]|uniref:MerR family transcriptional regulator n=1 Tax=Desulfosediminicola sp. TaxID=2886825 RepID=UPI003AF2B45C